MYVCAGCLRVFVCIFPYARGGTHGKRAAGKQASKQKATKASHRERDEQIGRIEKQEKRVRFQYTSQGERAHSSECFSAAFHIYLSLLSLYYTDTILACI